MSVNPLMWIIFTFIRKGDFCVRQDDFIFISTQSIDCLFIKVMWKSTTGSTITAPATNSNSEDDWETDPNYVNNVSEKDQRWAPGATSTAGTAINMAQLTKEVITQNEVDSKKNWEVLNGKDIKNSYGVDKNKKI
jgi:cortactin